MNTRSNGLRGDPISQRGNETPDDPNMKDIFRALIDITSVLQRQVERSDPPQPKVAPGERQARAFKKFMDLRPRTFAGSANKEDAETWISHIQRTLEIIATPIEFHVMFGSYLLVSEADIWWSSVKFRMDVGQLNWGQFVEMFNTHFIPKAYRMAKMREFMELKQGKMTVSEYAFQFTSLSRYCVEIVANEQMRAMKFQDGLKFKLRSQVVAFQFTTFDEVVEAALLLEQEFVRSQGQRHYERKNQSKGKGVHGAKRNQVQSDEGGSKGKRSKGRYHSSSSSGSTGNCSMLESYQGQHEMQPYQSQFQPFQHQGYQNTQTWRNVEQHRPHIQYPQQVFQNQRQQQVEQRPQSYQQHNQQRVRGGGNRNNQAQARAYGMVQPNEGASNAVIKGVELDDDVRNQ